MTQTRFLKIEPDQTPFLEAGMEMTSPSFHARIEVGDDGISRAVPHVNNTEYVRWIDRLAEMATDDAGFTRESLLADQRMWFVARHEIDYRGEAFMEDRLLAATWIKSWTRTTAHRATAVIDASSHRVICVATTRWAYVDLENRRPARIPAHVREVFPGVPQDGESRG